MKPVKGGVRNCIKGHAQMKEDETAAKTRLE